MSYPMSFPGQTPKDDVVKSEPNSPGCSSDDHTTSDEEDPNDFIEKPYISRADLVLNMDRMTKAEREACLQFEPEFMERAQKYKYEEDLEDPEDLFGFFFFNLPTPPIPPELKKLKFSDVSGPIKHFTPYEAFTAIWNKTFMMHVVRETNNNAKENNSEWTDTHVDELYVFLAITLATSKMRISKIFWNSSKNISQAMTRKRFMELNKYLSFINLDMNSYRSPKNKLFKIKPIIDHFNKSFSSLYIMNQDIVLDEPPILRKSNDGKFMKLENNCGIQEVNVCDAKNGYVWKLDVLVHDKNLTRGIPPCLILDFLEEIENKGHTVWSNNVLHRLMLARVLKQLGFNTVGTLRMTDIVSGYSQQTKAGEVSGCTSGDLDFIAWRHKKLVTFVSNYHGKTTTEENRKSIPTAFVDYKNIVASLENRDQILAAYNEGANCKSWIQIMFRRLLNVSVFNSSILYKCNEQSQKSHKEFRFELIRELISRHGKKGTDTQRSSETAMISGELSPENKKEDLIKRVVLPQRCLEHFPEELEVKSGDEQIKKSCSLCHCLTTTYCPACNVPLCLSSCHKLYHSVSMIP